MAIKSKIIFVNGPSSAGKSTLSREIQRTMPEPFYYMAIDQYQLGVAPPEDLFPGINFHNQCMQMFYEAVKIHIRDGINLIIDDVIDSDWYYLYVIEALKDAEVFWIRLDCSLETLLLRESNRNDRKKDFDNVTMQFHQLKPTSGYNLILDSEHCDAVSNCAIVRKEYYNDTF